MNIILCGFMGCGKTTVSKQLHELLSDKFSVVDTDLLIEKKLNMKIKDIFKEKGEDFFRQAEYEVCKELSKKDNQIISTGGGALTFERNAEVLKKNGIIIFLDASFETVCERIGHDSSRPLFKDKTSAKKLYDSRKSIYSAVCDFKTDADEDVYTVSQEILKKINV